MLLLVAAGVIALIMLAHMLEGAFKAAVVVLLGCILFVFACDYFQVDWHVLVQTQTRQAGTIARHELKLHERELRERGVL